MSEQTTQPPAPPEAPKKEGEGGDKVINPKIEEALENAIIRVANMAAGITAGSNSAQDLKDLGQASMYFAQALIISNPELVAPDGVPIDAVHPPRALAKVNKDAISGQVVSGEPRGAKA